MICDLRCPTCRSWLLVFLVGSAVILSVMVIALALQEGG